MAKVPDVPAQGHEVDDTNTELDPKPKIIVLGHMDGQVAARLGWRHGLSVISNSRFRFLKEELDFDVTDNRDDYLF